MTFNFASRVLCILCATLVMGVFAPAAFATEKTAVKSIAADIPMEQRLDALQRESEVSCPRPLEHVLPGAYYECVGTRDIARGKTDRARGMLETAASWGSKKAQFTLGIGYYKGDVQPLDRGLGLAWLGLAAERRKPVYVAIFNSAWEHASPQERERGNALWKEMLPKYGDKYAARRAEQRYIHERDRMMANAAYGAKICFGADDPKSERTLGVDTKAVGVPTPNCGQMPVEVVVKVMDQDADRLLDGWAGRVTVGPLQQTSAPTK